MFAKEEKKQTGNLVGLIGKGVTIEGRLCFDETVRIDGRFKGEINSNGTLVVGEDGFVEGEINVMDAIVTGVVSGTLDAKNRVELKAPGRMLGEIRTPNLIVGEGAQFEGRCVMKRRGEEKETLVVEYGGEPDKDAANEE